MVMMSGMDGKTLPGTRGSYPGLRTPLRYCEGSCRERRRSHLARWPTTLLWPFHCIEGLSGRLVGCVGGLCTNELGGLQQRYSATNSVTREKQGEHGVVELFHSCDRELPIAHSPLQTIELFGEHLLGRGARASVYSEKVPIASPSYRYYCICSETALQHF